MKKLLLIAIVIVVFFFSESIFFRKVENVLYNRKSKHKYFLFARNELFATSSNFYYPNGQLESTFNYKFLRGEDVVTHTQPINSMTSYYLDGSICSEVKNGNGRGITFDFKNIFISRDNLYESGKIIRSVGYYEGNLSYIRFHEKGYKNGLEVDIDKYNMTNVNSG
jgi:antitoxin component YwqK of YwqJK toxin-antitoxin module